MPKKKVLVSLFNNTTQEEFLSSLRTHLGNTTRLNNCEEGDIIVLQNIESKNMFGVALIGAYDDGKVYAEHHPLEMDIYSGNAAKYNRYEIKIKNFKKVNVSFEDIACICGKSLDDPVRNNIWKGSCFSFRKANYTGEDSENVMKRFHILLNSLLTTE